MGVPLPGQRCICDRVSCDLGTHQCYNIRVNQRGSSDGSVCLETIDELHADLNDWDIVHGYLKPV